MEALFHENVSLILRGLQGMLSQNTSVIDKTFTCAKYMEQPWNSYTYNFERREWVRITCSQ